MMPVGDTGVTLGNSLQQVSDVTGESIRSLAKHENDCPVELEYLWEIFMELNQTRGAGFGPSAIQYQEIAAWRDLMSVPIMPWEVHTIRKLDHIFLEACDARSRSTKHNNQ